MSTATKRVRKAKNDTKPKRDFNVIGQDGLKAQALAVQYQAEIGKRLASTFLPGFAADIGALTAALPAVITSKDGQIQLTAAQVTALDAGAKIVTALRTTVKSREPAKDVLLAYGVGARMSKELVKDVTAALQKIAKRVTEQPAEASEFGIVDEDVKSVQTSLTAIEQADKAQEVGRATGPQTTAQRNATARRVLSGVKTIAGAGMRTFVNNPTVYANFEALIRKKPTRSAAKAKTAAEKKADKDAQKTTAKKASAETKAPTETKAPEKTTAETKPAEKATAKKASVETKSTLPFDAMPDSSG